MITSTDVIDAVPRPALPQRGPRRAAARFGPGLRAAVAALLYFALALLAPAVRADTVASLLGDFTINQFGGLRLAGDAARLHFTIVFGQLPALRELHQADANGDGVTSQEERDAYVSRLAPGLAAQLALTVDDKPVPLRALAWTSSLPKEQTGFSLRIDIDYAGDLPPAGSGAIRSLTLVNRNFPGRIGWHELVVTTDAGLHAFDTNAFSTSLTGGLGDAVGTLPASGPLDEREVHLRFTRGTPPPEARLLAARDAPLAVAAADETSAAAAAGDNAWLSRQTRRLIEMISTPTVSPKVTALALLIALLMGAFHALSPGHGKSIVGAYLVGSRGTPKHAAFLGITVTVTHTLVVFAIGAATLLASRYVLPERLFPILSLLSGLLVLGMGLVLLAQRLREARLRWVWPGGSSIGAAHGMGPLAFAAAPGHHAAPVHGHDHGHPHGHGHGHGHSHAHGHGHAHGHAHDHDHGHGHAHDHDHGHAHAHVHGHAHAHANAHAHAHASALTHTHGGTTHSHLPPGADGQAVTWRALLALGVSGGLLPCPSAMVLLLAAVALNKTFFGLLLVVAFSVGLALTLTLVGMAFLYARNRLQPRLGRAAGLVRALPLLSAACITGLGLMLCVTTLVAKPF